MQTPEVLNIYTDVINREYGTFDDIADALVKLAKVARAYQNIPQRRDMRIASFQQIQGQMQQLADYLDLLVFLEQQAIIDKFKDTVTGVTDIPF
jgi:hypothetical protein